MAPRNVNPAWPVSTPRFVFLDPRAREFYADWDRAAGETVAVLRAEAARDPDDRDLADLVGELSTKIEEFRTLWAAHNVRLHNTGVKHLHHPVVGDLSLNYNGLAPGCELRSRMPQRLSARSREGARGRPARPTRPERT
jgi:hypothetical protein